MFIQVKVRNREFYIAASEVTEVDPMLEEVRLRDGRRLKLSEWGAVEQLTGGGIIRGVACDGGAIVAVPLGSIDHVAESWDDASGEWMATATTQGGLRFVVDPVGRVLLGMDSEIHEVELLRAQAARLHAADSAAEAAVEEAERCAAGAALKVA